MKLTGQKSQKRAGSDKTVKGGPAMTFKQDKCTKIP